MQSYQSEAATAARCWNKDQPISNQQSGSAGCVSTFPSRLSQYSASIRGDNHLPIDRPPRSTVMCESFSLFLLQEEEEEEEETILGIKLEICHDVSVCASPARGHPGGR